MTPENLTGEIPWLERHWRWWLLLIWLVACALLIFKGWNQIMWFGLGDTDDNMRMMQVRDLIAGQSWYDLRQYRLDPPGGADMHWSRLVDLPIAGIKLLLSPLMGGALAEKVAVTIAPLLPALVVMGALALTVRRLVAPLAFALALGIMFCAPSAVHMFAPLRIDHHGWQLAMLALALASFTDPKPARGGLLLGAASAVSFAIGLEMLLYLALAGGMVVLLWVRDRAEAPRLQAYGLALGGGSALGFLLFASEANRAPLCDAFSPVWLSAMLGAGAAASALAMLRLETWPRRLAAAAAGGLALAAFFALAWPHCLGRLEGVSPQAEQLWLRNVREAMPLWRHGLQRALVIAALPAIGLAGYALMAWRARRDPAALLRWAPPATLALLAFGLLFWQTRAGPAAQLLAVPGAAALGWAIIPPLRRSRLMLVRVFGTVAGFLLVSGLAVGQGAAWFVPDRKAGTHMKRVNRANGRCPTMAALAPVARVPKGLVLTFVDLGPRLITVTPHDAIAGPYHRNDEDIVFVQTIFRGTTEAARPRIQGRGIDYVLICLGLSESTIYQANAPRGFYARLAKGEVPGWLSPVKLPANSPYRMYRVIRPERGQSLRIPNLP